MFFFFCQSLILLSLIRQHCFPERLRFQMTCIHGSNILFFYYIFIFDFSPSESKIGDSAFPWLATMTTSFPFYFLFSVCPHSNFSFFMYFIRPNPAFFILFCIILNFFINNYHTVSYFSLSDSLFPSMVVSKTEQE